MYFLRYNMCCVPASLIPVVLLYWFYKARHSRQFVFLLIEAYSIHSKVLSLVVVFAAISAPLKLKASRGPPTPINRNQASQPRGGQSMLGKRSFDTVSSLDTEQFHFCDVICRSSFIKTFTTWFRSLASRVQVGLELVPGGLYSTYWDH